MSYEDATASWSGYIFQGEVAILYSLKKINELKASNNYSPFHLLKLEEDEDFSIEADEKIVYQVKARSKEIFSDYSGTIKNLINKYLYTSLPFKRKIVNAPKVRLVTRKTIRQYTSKRDTLFTAENFSLTTDEYDTLMNIVNLENINPAIIHELNIYFNDPTINTSLICDYLCKKISDYVKERHRTKVIQSILFSQIESWILNPPKSITEEIFWHYIKKQFIEILIEEAEDRESIDCSKQITQVVSMSVEEIKSLFTNHISAYKELPKEYTYSYLDEAGSKNVVARVLKDVGASPIDTKKLIYKKADDKYQITTHSINPNGIPKKLQREIKRFYQNLQDFNNSYIVTEHLTVPKEDLPNDITETEKEEESIVELNECKGFVNVEDAINQINN